MRAIACLLVVAALADCGSATAPPAKSACKTRVDDAIAFLRAMNHDRPLATSAETMHLATRLDMPVRKPADDLISPPVVNLMPGSILLEGEVLDRPAVVAKLSMIVARNRQWADERYDADDPKRPDLHRVFLAIDGDVPWREVASIGAALVDAGVDHVALVFGKPSPVAPPPRTAIDDRLDQAPRGEFAPTAGRLLKELVEPCPPLTRAITAASNDPGPDLPGRIIERAGPALVECDCKVDPASFRSFVWRTEGNTIVETLLELRLARTGKVFELPAATRWREAHHTLAPGATLWWR